MKISKEEITQKKMERNKAHICYCCSERTDEYQCREYCWNYAVWVRKQRERKVKNGREKPL